MSAASSSPSPTSSKVSNAKHNTGKDIETDELISNFHLSTQSSLLTGFHYNENDNENDTESAVGDNENPSKIKKKGTLSTPMEKIFPPTQTALSANNTNSLPSSNASTSSPSSPYPPPSPLPFSPLSLPSPPSFTPIILLRHSERADEVAPFSCRLSSIVNDNNWYNTNITQNGKRMAFDAGKVVKFILQNSQNDNNTDNNAKDNKNYRQLSDIGWSSSLPLPSTIYVSPCLRTIETAQYFISSLYELTSASSSHSPSPSVLLLPGLAHCAAAFRKEKIPMIPQSFFNKDAKALRDYNEMVNGNFKDNGKGVEKKIGEETKEQSNHSNECKDSIAVPSSPSSPNASASSSASPSLPSPPPLTLLPSFWHTQCDFLSTILSICHHHPIGVPIIIVTHREGIRCLSESRDQCVWGPKIKSTPYCCLGRFVYYHEKKVLSSFSQIDTIQFKKDHIDKLK